MLPPGSRDHFCFTVSRRLTFRRYSGSPLEARFTLKVSVHNGRLRRPGNAGSPAGDKRGKGHRMVPFPPLDTPNLPLDAQHSFASKSEGPTDVFGAPQGFHPIEAELFAARIQRPAQNGRALLCAANHGNNRLWHKKKESTGSNLCSPSFLDAQPKGVASKGRSGGVKRGIRNHLVSYPPLAPAGGHRQPLGRGVRPFSPPAAHRCIGGRFTVSRR